MQTYYFALVRNLGVVVLLSAVWLYGYGQKQSETPQPPAASPMRGQSFHSSSNATVTPKPAPDDVLWRSFFHNVVSMENFGDKLDADGHDSKYTRDKIAKDIGLNSAEEATLKRAAKDWTSKEAAFYKQWDAIMRSTDSIASKKQQYAAMKTQFETDEANEIAQLKTALGDRFALVQNYVHTVTAQHVSYAEVRKGNQR